MKGKYFLIKKRATWPAAGQWHHSTSTSSIELGSGIKYAWGPFLEFDAKAIDFTILVSIKIYVRFLSGGYQLCALENNDRIGNKFRKINRPHKLILVNLQFRPSLWDIKMKTIPKLGRSIKNECLNNFLSVLCSCSFKITSLVKRVFDIHFKWRLFSFPARKISFYN